MAVVNIGLILVLQPDIGVVKGFQSNIFFAPGKC